MLNVMEQWKKWLRGKPGWVIWVAPTCVCLIYYLLVILPLSYSVSDLQDNINIERNKATWMTRAGREILGLRQSSAHKKANINESAFTIVNQAINTQGWNSLVTDIHQVEQNRIQVTFSAIAFSELISWLEKLYDQSGIFVLEATLQKKQPGVVAATLVLQESGQ